MTTPVTAPDLHPWFTTFRQQPASTLDELLSGLSRIPPYERAIPSEILKRLFGARPKGDADLKLLDTTLRDWLAMRWRDWDAPRREAYGLPRFVTEFMDALSVVWLLELPGCGDWLQENFTALLPWAAPLRLSRNWDLPRGLAQAAALTQQDQRLRPYWFLLCREASRPSRRVLIDAALSGLGNLPDARGHGASPDLIAGLARFGAGLTDAEGDRTDFLRRWRSLKVRFPRAATTWQRLWHDVLEDPRYTASPFRQWLLESDRYLERPIKGVSPVQLPADIRGAIARMVQCGRQPEGRDRVLREAGELIAQLERYAEATGDTYFLVTSATNLGKDMVAWAPGHVLAWVRRALRWEPGNPQAWSLRGRALQHLGRADLAQAVYWEAARRLPDNPVVRNQLALLFVAEGRTAEAETLLREVHGVDPTDAVARVELARLLARTGREPEAEGLLRRTVLELPGNPIARYTFAHLLIAWGRHPEAREERDRYVQRFGANRWTATLDRLLAAGSAGVAEARQHLELRSPAEEQASAPVAADTDLAQRQALAEEKGGELLRRSAEASQADLLFRIEQHEAARAGLSRLLDADRENLYGRVVWALYEPDQRPALANRYREQLGLLAPHLAAATPATGVDHWHRLLNEFPERQPLIDFTRLLRSGQDIPAAQRLRCWVAEGKANGDAYLQNRLREALPGDQSLHGDDPALHALLNVAIRREVDLLDPSLLQP